MATTDELEQIIAYWQAMPERIFGAAPDDTRSPIYGVDAVDGRKSFYLLLLNYAVQQRQRRRGIAATTPCTMLATAPPVRSATAGCTLDVQRITITDEKGSLFQAAVATYSISQILTAATVEGTFVYDGRAWVCIARNDYAALSHQVIPIAAADQLPPSRETRPFTSLAGRVVHHDHQPLLIVAATLAITYQPHVIPDPQSCSSPQISIFELLGESIA